MVLIAFLEYVSSQQYEYNLGLAKITKTDLITEEYTDIIKENTNPYYSVQGIYLRPIKQ